MNCNSVCVVRGCTISYANRPAGVSLVRFPNDERTKKWVEAVKGKGSDWVPPKNTKICTLHFEANQFWKNPAGKRKQLLLPGAVPTPAPQLPPASTILPKHLPNSTTYVYRKKKGTGVQSPDPKDLSSSQEQQLETPSKALVLPKITSRTGCAVRGCTVTYANRPDGVVLFRFPNDERLPRWVEAVKGKGSDWVPPKSTKICSLHFEANQFWKNHPGKRKKLLLPGAVPTPAPQLPPASTILPKHLPNSTTYVYRKKKGTGVQSPDPKDLSSSQQQQPETPSKALVLSSAPVPVCLDIEEEDSPCKRALKHMIEHLENQVREGQRKLEQERKLHGQTRRELEALKEIVRKATDFELSSYSIDAPSHWGDRAIIWHARPSVVGP